MRCIAVIFMLLSVVASFAAPWDADSVKSIFDGRTLQPIEGVWQLPDDGAILLVTQSTASTFAIILLDSPDLSLMPGEEIGKLVSTPNRNVYDGYITKRGDKPLNGKNATFTVTDEGTLRIDPYSTGQKISLRRWIYRVFKISVVNANSRPRGLDGAIRLYPHHYNRHAPVSL